MTKRDSIFEKTGHNISSEDVKADDVTVILNQDSPKQQGVPVDTGWAWVVLFAAWCNCLLCNGIYRAFGVMFIEIQARYGSNSSMTSLIVSAMSGSYSISALLVTTIGLRHFSNRQFIVLGSIIMACAFSLSSLAPTVEILILLLGCVNGISQGMIFAPTMALISEYFEKYRSMANCITNMGSGVGSLVFSLLIPFWIEEYAFPGTVLLIGGLILQATFTGLLMRPVTFYTKQTIRDNKKENFENDLSKVNVEKINEKETNNFSIIQHDIKNQTVDIDMLQSRNITKRSESPLIESNHSLHSPLTVERKRSISDLSLSNISQKVGSAFSSLNNSNFGLYSSSELAYSSMLNLSSKRPNHLENNLTERQKPSDSCFSSTICSIIDCRPMKRLTFLFFIPCCCCMVNVTPIAIYLPAFAKDFGLSSKECDILITIISITDVCTVVFWGIFADRNYVKRYKILSFAIVTVGVTTCFTPLFNSHTVFIVFSVIYGIFGRVYFSFYPVVLVDFIGLENLRSAFGIVGLVQSGTLAILQPVIGLMRDHFKTYIPGMLLLSALVVVGGLLVNVLPVVERFERQKQTEEIEVD